MQYIKTPCNLIIFLGGGGGGGGIGILLYNKVQLQGWTLYKHWLGTYCPIIFYLLKEIFMNRKEENWI